MLIAGNLTSRSREIFQKNPMFTGMKLPEVRSIEPFENRFPTHCSKDVIDIMRVGCPSSK